MPVHHLGVVVAKPRRNRHPDRHVREEEAAGEKLGGSWFATGQFGRGEHGPDGQGWRQFDPRYRLIQNIFLRLLIGNFGLRGVGNLVAATRTRRDFAVGQQQFTEMQTNFSARPEDGVTNAIRQIDFAGFGGTLQTGVAVIEVRVMPANYPVAQCLKAEIVEIFHASRNHRVRIDTGDPRAELRGLGARRHESDIFANVSPRPKRFWEDLGSMQGG